MNIASDPKLIPQTGLFSAEANQAAALAAYGGVLTVDLDAIIANWRKLEKIAVPAECAAVIKADAYGCGTGPVARALSAAGCKTFFVATLDEARAAREAVPSAAIYTLTQVPGGDAAAGRLVIVAIVIALAALVASEWFARRAGMRYRDLLPGRQGGRVIASHIQIPDGGPVRDDVHFHRIHFQMIYCCRGWVRVVYEDQGAPFVLEPGDCVLQPPGMPSA